MAEAGRRSVGYPDGGLYVLRAEGIYAIARAGDTGMRGLGGHAHNDQLSFELSGFGRPLIIDPGAYLYTAAPEERNRFRSTAFHSTLQIDDAEQNDLGSTYLFSLPDRTRTEVLAWEPDVPRLRARHHGYEGLPEPATHSRSIALEGKAAMMVVEDELDSVGSHRLLWTFPLAGGEPRIDRGWCLVEIGGVDLAIRAPDGVELTIEPGFVSPSYGVRRPTPFLRGRGRSAPGLTRWRWELLLGLPPSDS